MPVQPSIKWIWEEHFTILKIVTHWWSKSGTRTPRGPRGLARRSVKLFLFSYDELEETILYWIYIYIYNIVTCINDFSRRGLIGESIYWIFTSRNYN
jgi:hypothetical protein